MVKTITKFVCQECGYDSPQWLGKCPECGNWNSFKEFHEAKSVKGKALSGGIGVQSLGSGTKPQLLKDITLHETSRILSGFAEMDTVMGGGIVPGSVTLLAGDPGIGKSTLLLQLALNVASGQGPVAGFPPTSAPRISSEMRPGGSPSSRTTPHAEQKISKNLPLLVGEGGGEVFPSKKVLYISGEESVEQIKLRASRIKGALENTNLFLVSLTDVDAIVQLIEAEHPSLVVIDSIQTMESQALDGLSGSVGQVRYATTAFIRAAKTLKIPVIIVGHVTKEGMVAGPMVLSHMVDTVLFLEGEKFTATRLLRSFKNRFGPVDEVGVFTMAGEGMQEVKNPEELFLTKRTEAVPGSVSVVIMEGTRPFLIEIQALAVYSKLAMPRRVAAGIDHKRVELLLAVLQKQCNLNVDSYDVFVNVAGGLKVTDPAVDIGVCLAVFSSLKNKPLQKVVGIAEVGLLGELRGVGNIDKRIKEAKKLGFSTIITPKTHTSLPQALQSLGLGLSEKTTRSTSHSILRDEPSGSDSKSSG
jgi:DNA repair protein RadA/Sms